MAQTKIRPKTMKLPDFLEEYDQVAEKAFGKLAQAIIDSLLHAKLPPKLKRSVDMARLENASYEEVVTHLERELELNGLEERDEIPVATMSTAPAATRPPFTEYQPGNLLQLLQETRSYQKRLQKTETKEDW